MNEENYIFRLTVLRNFPAMVLFYLLPHKTLKSRNLHKLPRDPMVVALDDNWRKLFQSSRFTVELMDLWALTIFNAFDIRGGFVNYSYNHPFVMLALDINFWIEYLSQTGLSIENIARLPDGFEIAFPTEEQISEYTGRLVYELMSNSALPLNAIKEVVEKYPCHEDYGKNNSHAKYDFYRSYYHTRTKTTMQPLVDGDIDLIREAQRRNPYKEVEFKLWLESFLQCLTGRDPEIVHLLIDGCTQEEIAQTLGYANHSGVCKRIKHIREQMIKYKQAEVACYTN